MQTDGSDGKRPFGVRNICQRTNEVEKDLTYRGHHDTAELLLAYQTAVGKGKTFLPPPMESFSAIVATPTVGSFQNDLCAPLFMERA